MSLRVLLADESSTIKKVFELGLKDYGVEVKNVNSGLDVVPVCGSFVPDIVFADVLLQKRNGYDVCSEIKAQPGLSALPVVLMWSSFMELDQAKLNSCGANDKLEKPFDVDKLRSLITSLVPRVSDQKLSSLMSFSPKINHQFVGEEKEKSKNPEIWKKRAEEELNNESEFNTVIEEHMPLVSAAAPEVSLDGLQFSPDPISENTSSSMGEDLFPEIENLVVKSSNSPSSEDSPDSWESKSFGKFKVDLPSDDPSDNFSSISLGDANLDLEPAVHIPSPSGRAAQEVQLPAVEEQVLSHISQPIMNQVGASLEADLQSPEMEAMIKAHVESVVKLSIHQLLPDIIEKVVRESLDKLLNEEIQNELGD